MVTKSPIDGFFWLPSVTKCYQVISGPVVRAADAASGAVRAENARVVTRPDPNVVACFAQAATSAAPKGLALGLIETRSTVALVKAMDEMLKGAAVEYEGRMKVGYYLTAGAIRGDVGEQ